jgi:hypothetical protein
MKPRHLYPAVLLALLFFGSFSTRIGWQEYFSSAGKYKVSMPAAPKEDVKKVPTAVGELTMYMALLESEDENDDNMLYMSAFSEYPADKISSDLSKESLERFFKGAAEGSAKNMNGKVTSITVENYKEYPGRNIVSQVNLGGMDFLALQRLILVKNRFYMLQTLTKKDKEDNSNTRKFFESFSLEE